MSMELTAELHYTVVYRSGSTFVPSIGKNMLKCWRRWNNSTARDCMRFIAAKIKCNFVVNWGENAWRGSNEWMRRREYNTYWEMTLNYIKSLHKMFQSLKINLSLFFADQHSARHVCLMKFFRWFVYKQKKGEFCGEFQYYLACRFNCAFIYHNKLRLLTD